MALRVVTGDYGLARLPAPVGDWDQPSACVMGSIASKALFAINTHQLILGNALWAILITLAGGYLPRELSAEWDRAMARSSASRHNLSPLFEDSASALFVCRPDLPLAIERRDIGLVLNLGAMLEYSDDPALAILGTALIFITQPNPS